MTTPDTTTIWLSDAELTHKAGVSLTSTLYKHNLTIGLNGELGAGKTTFLQGFLSGLGIDAYATSPTYALEQRYQSEVAELLHIDLYRLSPEQAERFLDESEDFHGIRCIEWIERSSVTPDILLELEDKDNGRQLTVTFNDIAIPTDDLIRTWQQEVHLTENVVRHCNAVAQLSLDIARDVQKRGTIVRPKALYAAALTHDLLRFIDFVPGASYNGEDDHHPDWDTWKTKYNNKGHEIACAEFLRNHGYPDIGTIVEPHGLKLPSPDRTTIEQKILFYADKRVRLDEVVTLDERFEDFRKRYNGGEHSEKGDIWLQEARAIEQELLN